MLEHLVALKIRCVRASYTLNEVKRTKTTIILYSTVDRQLKKTMNV